MGRAVSDTERAIFTLPTRLGGLNIPNPVNTASKEYEWSKTITHSLSDKIRKQLLMEAESQEEINTTHSHSLCLVKAEKSNIQKTLSISIYESVDDEMKRSLDLASEKGAPIWLNTLPIKKTWLCPK